MVWIGVKCEGDSIYSWGRNTESVAQTGDGGWSERGVSEVISRECEWGRYIRKGVSQRRETRYMGTIAKIFYDYGIMDSQSMEWGMGCFYCICWGGYNKDLKHYCTVALFSYFCDDYTAAHMCMFCWFVYSYREYYQHPVTFWHPVVHYCGRSKSSRPNLHWK